MKIKDLAGIAYSTHGDLQMAVLYNYNTQKDVATGTVEHIISNYGELELTRLQAYEHSLIFEVRV